MIIDFPTPDHRPALRKLWQEAFNDSDQFLDSFFSILSYDQCRCILQHGQPVAAVYLLPCRIGNKKLCYLYALTVKKTCRGQGLSRILLVDTHAFLRQQGISGVLIEPATDSLSHYYESMGYHPFPARSVVTVCAGTESVKLTTCGASAYAEKRNCLLNLGGVDQSGNVLEVLADQKCLFIGDDFVAAVSREEKRILEFLGNEIKIPGLLCAMELKSASVVIPGTQVHGLFLPFSSNCPVPTYFGLPLD